MSSPRSIPVTPAATTTTVGRGAAVAFERDQKLPERCPVRGFRRGPERLRRVFGRRRCSGAGRRRGTPGATPWVTASGPHGSQLTGLTQSTADWAGPVTDMRAPPQKLKKKMFYK